MEENGQKEYTSARLTPKYFDIDDDREKGEGRSHLAGCGIRNWQLIDVK